MSMLHSWLYEWDRMIFYYSSCISIVLSIIMGYLCLKYWIKLSKSTHMTKQYKARKRGRIYKCIFLLTIPIASISLVLFCYLGILREVPDVERMLYRVAVTKLTQTQLQYNLLEDKTDALVIEQSIPAGTIVLKGTKITLLVDEED